MKRCFDCQQEKPLTDYWADKRRPDGGEEACKDCRNARRRDGKNSQQSAAYRERKRLAGQPRVGPPKGKTLEWMVARSKLDENGCWIWQQHLDKDGYGRVTDGNSRTAHRVVYEAVHGPLPPDLVPDHLCRVRACINPDHLEAVTAKENKARGQRHLVALLRRDLAAARTQLQELRFERGILFAYALDEHGLDCTAEIPGNVWSLIQAAAPDSKGEQP